LKCYYYSTCHALPCDFISKGYKLDRKRERERETERQREREREREREKTRTRGLLPIAFQCPTIVCKEGNSLVISLANIVRDGMFSL
jgi:hypothetical protein